MKVYAIAGDSQQLIDESGIGCPLGWVVMDGQRPDADSIARADGTWDTAADPVPALCTRRQGLLALLSHGIKRADIEAQIAAMEDEVKREEAQIEYEAATWERNNQHVQSMWVLLGGDPEQLDDVFRLAVTL